jgi:hypothetical protein
VCIVGLASSGELESSVKSIHCALVRALHVLTYGDLEKGWVGLEPLSFKLDTFNRNLSTFLNTTGLVFGGDGNWVGNAKTALAARIVTLDADTLSVVPNVGDFVYSIQPVVPP